MRVIIGPLFSSALREAIEALVVMLSPFAPHTAEELWEQLGHDDGLTATAWPTCDEAVAQADTVVVLESQEFTGFILRSIAVPSPDSSFRDLMPLVERGLSPLGLFVVHAFGTELEDTRKDFDQFNSLHEKLIARWERISNALPPGTPLHFSCMKDNEEDRVTIDYLRDTALQAGVATQFV